MEGSEVQFRSLLYLSCLLYSEHCGLYTSVLTLMMLMMMTTMTMAKKTIIKSTLMKAITMKKTTTKTIQIVCCRMGFRSKAQPRRINFVRVVFISLTPLQWSCLLNNRQDPPFDHIKKKKLLKGMVHLIYKLHLKVVFLCIEWHFWFSSKNQKKNTEGGLTNLKNKRQIPKRLYDHPAKKNSWQSQKGTRQSQKRYQVYFQEFFLISRKKYA